MVVKILTMEPMGKGVQFVVDCLKGEKGEIVLFTDELRNMTCSDDLGAGLVELAEPTCSFRGIVHLVADEVTVNYIELRCGTSEPRSGLLFWKNRY